MALGFSPTLTVLSLHQLGEAGLFHTSHTYP